MASAHVSDVTDANFESEVLNSDRPVLVDFWATWCAPCKAIAPSVETIAADNTAKLKVVKLDIQANPGTARRFGVTSIPTLLVFNGGNVVNRLVGAAPMPKLKALVQPVIG
ncbi:MAG TPA: thioredoxin [Myxococcota bacterium]|nr:thioredoxin [Myxococcota bacterium]